MKLSPNETKLIVTFYYSNQNSPTKAARAFNTWAANNNSNVRVSKKNVIDAIKRFEANTTLQHSVKKRAPASKDENILLNVVSSLYYKPGSSIRTCAADIDLSVGTTHHIARHVLQLRPYRVALVQKLTEYDKIVRVFSCHNLLLIISNNPNVVYSDEASCKPMEYVSLGL